MKTKIVFIALLTLLFVGSATSGSPDGLYMEPLEVSPDTITEGEEVEVRAVSYSPFSLNYMEFYVNGDKKKKTICSSSLSFPTPFNYLPFGCAQDFRFTPENSGKYDLKVYSQGLLGSSSRTKSIEVESDGEIDNPAPEVNSIEFTPSQPIPGEEVEINVIASDTSSNNILGMESISAKADGENIGSKVCGIFDSACEARFSYTPDSSGAVDLEITAKSSDGQVTKRTKKLYIREELSSSGVTGTVSNPVTLYVEMTDGIDASDYECYWDDEDSVSESDNKLDREGNRFEAEESFDGGNHEVYMGCFRDGSSSNTVSTSFSIEENEGPEADLDIDPENAETGEDVEFDASESEDSDGEIDRYRWDFDDDGDYDRTTDDDTTEKSFSDEFDGEAKVEVRDDDGATDTTTTSYTVGKNEKTCEIETSDLQVSDTKVSSGEEIDVWLNLTNKQDSDQELTTSFIENGEEFFSKTKTIGDGDSHNFSTTFEVEDSTTLNSEVSTSGDPCEDNTYEDSVEIEADIEGVEADFEFEPENPEVDEEVEFDASDTVSENDVESYRWDFDDGNSKLGKKVTHSFGEEDDYDVELEVEDENGDTDTKTKTVEVGGKSTSEEGRLEVEVEDEEGDVLEDARVKVSNGDSESERTDRDGEAGFDLQEDEYEVEVSKDGYRTRTKTVGIDQDETETLDFELRKKEDSELTVEVSDGFSVLDDVRVEVDGEVKHTDRGRSKFELGEGDYTVEASKNGYRTVSKFVDMDYGSSKTLRIELEKISRSERKSVSLSLGSSEISYGESVMVKGFVDNGDGRSNVKISRDEEELATVSTQPDGYFQAFVKPEKVGKHNIEASTGDASSSTPLDVRPTVSISSVTVPRKVFEGSNFRVCATVESQVSATVRLSRNGEHIDTNLRRGRTCFDQTASEPGENTYSVTAVVKGDSSSTSRDIEVLELDQEVESFPGNIAAVETESGMIKVDLYNTQDELRRYSLDVNGIDDSWVSQSKEQVILDKGERETAYFYITGREEGSFNPTITVESRGTTVFSEQVNVKIGGTKRAQSQSFVERLQGLLPF